MTALNNSINSEETIFYLDIIGDFLKKKTIIKGIKTFIEEKNKFNIPNSYGIVMFQGEKNPLTIYDKKDVSDITKAVDEAWEYRETNHSYFENGLFEILSYIFRKSRKIKKIYRVIVISDAPSELSEEYHNALYDLIVKAKNFLTFVDVIRIGKDKFYDDDVKLKIITSETKGGTFYCTDNKHFLNILGSLVKHKLEFNIVRTEGATPEESINLKEDKTFYDRLAVDLISLGPEDEEICDICEQELCPICEAYSDEIHKCFNCNMKFHNCCAAKYALTNNVGFRHIFRCPQCETLLKLDEDFVNMVYEEDLEEKEQFNKDSKITLKEMKKEKIKEENETVFNLEKDETIQESYDKIEQAEENLSIQDQNIEEPDKIKKDKEEREISKEVYPPSAPPSKTMTKTIKIGGFFGKEIEVPMKDSLKVKAESVKDNIFKTVLKTNKEDAISITKLRPPRKKIIKLCKICGASVSNTTHCPVCGAKIE
ncbi:MAG: hypothetical protein ACTSQJ_04395 [Promethearchaeota archaeon]